MEELLKDVTPQAYPARCKTTVRTLGDMSTHVQTMHFTDKIIITVAQEGRLPIWMNVPLSNSTAAPRQQFNYTDDETGEAGPAMGLLPLPGLTASMLLGGGSEERANVGMLLAAQVASTVVRRDAGEGRLLVLGLGLKKASPSREEFVELVDTIVGLL